MESSELSLCVSIQFCRLLCEELTFKMHLKFVSMYLLEVHKNTPPSYWIHQNWFCVFLVLLVNLLLPAKLRGDLCSLCVWGHSGENNNIQIQLWASVYVSLVLAIYLYLYLLLDFPLVTNEEISALPTVNVLPGGKYSGAKLKSVIRMLRGLLEQGVPSKEIEVSNYLSSKVLFRSIKQK